MFWEAGFLALLSELGARSPVLLLKLSPALELPFPSIFSIIVFPKPNVD